MYFTIRVRLLAAGQAMWNCDCPLFCLYEDYGSYPFDVHPGILKTIVFAKRKCFAWLLSFLHSGFRFFYLFELYLKKRLQQHIFHHSVFNNFYPPWRDLPGLPATGRVMFPTFIGILGELSFPFVMKRKNYDKILYEFFSFLNYYTILLGSMLTIESSCQWPQV